MEGRSCKFVNIAYFFQIYVTDTAKGDYFQLIKNPLGHLFRKSFISYFLPIHFYCMIFGKIGHVKTKAKLYIVARARTAITVSLSGSVRASVDGRYCVATAVQPVSCKYTFSKALEKNWVTIRSSVGLVNDQICHRTL
jgi:hypothetical protein